MAVKTNKILPFAVNAESNDLLSDDEYQKDVTRTGGNIVGIAKRRPNNKALKQASLIASALADIVARGSVFDGSKDDGYDIDDSLDRDTIAEYLFNTFTGIIKETSAGDDKLVHIENAETITGAKTFTQKLVAQNGVQIDQPPAVDTDAVRKGYIDQNFTLLPNAAETGNDANNLTTARRSLVSADVANLPEAKAGFIDTYKNATNQTIIQLFYPADNSSIYARTSNNKGESWGDWVLQTVSDLTAYVKSVNGVTPDPETGNVKIEVPDFVPSGTKMLFYQAASPTGWTKVTGIGNHAVKIVEDTTGGTAGGSVNFSDAFKNITTSSTTVTISGTTGGTAITVAQLASHNHSGNSGTAKAFPPDDRNVTVGGSGGATGSTGSNNAHTHSFSGSSSHTHTVNLAVKYINVIVCKKD